MNFEKQMGVSKEEFYYDYYKTAEYVFKMMLPPVGTKEDIEEGVADVLLEVMNHPEKYDVSRGGIKNYIRVIARSKALLMRRKIIKKQTIPLSEDFMISYTDEVLTKEFITDLIKNLKPKERQLFTMRFLYQMPVEDIAIQIGKSRGNVDTSLTRLRKKLKDELIKHEIDVKEV
ncbi:MAG: sigma-70 family RNA polymerase sigma factor [Turicibacter sp.]